MALRYYKANMDNIRTFLETDSAGTGCTFDSKSSVETGFSELDELTLKRVSFLKQDFNSV